MEALNCISHGSALVSQASHSPHDRSTTASLETDTGSMEVCSAGHGASYDCLPSYFRSGSPTGVRSLV